MLGAVDVEVDVLIVGAGPIGLSAIKAFKERGLSVLGVDKRPGVGGIWSTAYERGEPIYPRLLMNTSSRTTSFSDYPQLAAPAHQTVRQYHEYLQGYSRFFDLESDVMTSATVASINRTNSGFLVKINRDGEIVRASSKNVCVCAGFTGFPHSPVLKGEESFTGEVFHSGDFRDQATERTRSVVIVGNGNTALDIAMLALSRAPNARVLLSSRRPTIIVPRFLAGSPIDHYDDYERLYSSNTETDPPVLSQLINQHGVFVSASAGRTDPTQARITVNDYALEAIKSGRIELRGRIAGLCGTSVHFADGSKEEADFICKCTGWCSDISFLSHNVAEAALTPGQAYMDGRGDFSIIGTPIAWGGTPPVGEMQARCAAEIAGLLTKGNRTAAKRLIKGLAQIINGRKVLLYGDSLMRMAKLIDCAPAVELFRADDLFLSRPITAHHFLLSGVLDSSQAPDFLRDSSWRKAHS
jgi:Flavin-binding monooxygenase-like